MLYKKIASASIVTVIFTLIFLTLHLIIHSLIGRVYGPEGLGLYAAIIMFIGLYSMLSIFGIPSAISKYVAEYEERKEFRKIKETFSSALIFISFTSLLMGLLAFWITPNLGKLMHIDIPLESIILVIMALFFFSYSQVSQSFYQGLLNAFKSSSIQIVSLIGTTCIILYAYFFIRIPVYYAVVFGYAISGIFGLLLCGKDKAIIMNFSREQVWKILKFSLPVAFMSYFVFISQWIDRITLGIYLGVEEIGIFTAGVAITQAVRRIPFSLTPILVPSYSKINVYGKEKVEKALNLNIKFASIFLFLIASFTFIYAKEIVFILYGSKFVQAVLILQILSIGTFLSAITMPTSTLITGSGHPKLNLYLNLIGIPTQVTLVVLFTKYYNIIGTAVAGVLAGLVYVFGTLFMISKILGIHVIYRENLIKPIAAWIIFVLSYLFVFMIFDNSIFAGIISTAVYIFICWTKILSSYDKSIIRKMIGGPEEGQLK